MAKFVCARLKRFVLQSRTEPFRCDFLHPEIETAVFAVASRRRSGVIGAFFRVKDVRAEIKPSM